MRGTRLSELQSNSEQRIIPRVCGEHMMECMSIVVILGSSPRMRGTRVHDFGLCHNAGIIPAYAGNTGHLNPTKMIHGDHPRVCGEHFHQAFDRSFLPGSSPRMRGTRDNCAYRVYAGGIIPAYAGNTLRRRVDADMRWDHPRVCGEHPYAFGKKVLVNHAVFL